MLLKNLHLHFFKNYEDENFDFSSKVNVFTGENGAGKTNVLDAVYYLSFTKSFFNPQDVQNINHQSDFFMLSGSFVSASGSTDVVTLSVKRGERKRLRVNKKEHNRLADHIGLFPLVIVSPLDSELIYGGSEERRKYIDGFISQFDKNYLDKLMQYQKVLQQRNAYLKYLMENRVSDYSQLEIWDDKMAFLGAEIYQKRKTFLEDFIPVINKLYTFISNHKEEAGIEYRSHLHHGSLAELLVQNRQKDLALRHSSTGIHRDDLVFTLNGFPLKKFGSQGQQKSFLVALKLAQFEFTKEKKGFKPLLLLDDIFDKLDIRRVEQLMKLVSRNEFGQIFITDTNRSRVERIFNDINAELRIFEIEEGKIKNNG